MIGPNAELKTAVACCTPELSACGPVEVHILSRKVRNVRDLAGVLENGNFSWIDVALFQEPPLKSTLLLFGGNWVPHCSELMLALASSYHLVQSQQPTFG